MKVVFADVSRTDLMRIDKRLGAKKTHQQLLLRHFETEDADRQLSFESNMLRHVESERGLSHRRTTGEDREIAWLESRGHAIEVCEPRRHPRDHLFVFVKFCEQPLLVFLHLADGDEAYFRSAF